MHPSRTPFKTKKTYCPCPPGARRGIIKRGKLIKMKLLGIDYGRKKMGFAVGETDSKFAEPFSVMRFQALEEALEKIKQAVQAERAEKIVIGVSEGKMAEETKKFGKKLSEKLKMLVVFQDETLSSKDAQEFSIGAGIKRKKRKDMEDAFAAAIMLQNYLENNF